MKRGLFVILIILICSCSAVKKSSYLIEEDEIFVTRKYIGNYLDYRHTGPDTYDGPNLIWIKTSQDNLYGKISAYARKCEFSVGDRIYLKREYYNPGIVSGFWMFQVENDSSVYYKVTDFQYDKKVSTQSLFQ